MRALPKINVLQWSAVFKEKQEKKRKASTLGGGGGSYCARGGIRGASLLLKLNISPEGAHCLQHTSLKKKNSTQEITESSSSLKF